MIRIGTAGWSIAKEVGASFPGAGRHLARYSQVLNCAEINSSFKREHMKAVYERWARESGDGFEFCVKMPERISHDARLKGTRAQLELFMSQASGLGSKLAAVLVQLPPSFPYEAKTAREFFRMLGDAFGGAMVCEPRHASWFNEDVDHALAALHVSRAAADPARHEGADHPGGWLGDSGGGRPALHYYRWHGTPRVYWSSYAEDWIARQAHRLAALRTRGDCWCVFDNTASGAAIHNALQLSAHLSTGTR